MEVLILKDLVTRIKKYAPTIIVFSILLAVYPFAGIFFLGNGFIPAGVGLEKSDWLAFYGSYTSLIGTMLLVWVAVKQNDRINTINDRLLTVEENRNNPYIVISDYEVKVDFTISLTFWNITDIPVRSLKIGSFCSNNDGETAKEMVLDPIVRDKDNNNARISQGIVKGNGQFIVSARYQSSTRPKYITIVLELMNPHGKAFIFRYTGTLGEKERYHFKTHRDTLEKDIV